MCFSTHNSRAETSSAHSEKKATLEQSKVFTLSSVIAEDGSGIEILDATKSALGKAVSRAAVRFEKENGVKLTNDNSDSLNPEKEYEPVLIDAFQKAKGTGIELLMLYWIGTMHVFSNEEIYPAIFQAWKQCPNRWETILLYEDYLLVTESNRSSRAKKNEDKRAILLSVNSESRKLLAHVKTINPEIWKNNKILAWWFERVKKEYGSGPGAPTKPEHVLPSYGWAVSNCIYTELNFVSEKLCTALEAGQILGQIRSSCEDALRKEAGYINADQLRDFLKDRLPAVEKELAEHPELWPKELPKWDGKPSWEIKIEGE